MTQNIADHLHPSLFDQGPPCAALPPTLSPQLAMLIEALFLEIAVALATGRSAMSKITAEHLARGAYVWYLVDSRRPPLRLEERKRAIAEPQRLRNAVPTHMHEV